MQGIVSTGDNNLVSEWLRADKNRVALPEDKPLAGLVVSSATLSASSPDGCRIWILGTIVGYPDSEAHLAGGELAETLLGHYRMSGVNAFSDLKGLAAIAVWDNRTGTLHLIRHPGGVPTIFYRSNSETLEWATRLDALLRPGDRMDRISATQYLSFARVLSPRTLVENVHRVKPGEFVSVGPAGVVEGAIWKPRWTARDLKPSMEETTQELDRRLTRSVNTWLAATQKEPAILMSGGIDSVGLAAAITRTGETKLTAYTVAFDEYQGADDEFDEANRVTRSLGIEHKALRIGPRFIEEFLDWMVSWYGEPFGYGLHTAQLAEVAQGDHDLVFAGIGPDEWYPYSSELRWQPLTDRLPVSVARLGERVARPLGRVRGMKGLRFALYCKGSPTEYVIASRFGPATEDRTLLQLLDDPNAIESAATAARSYITKSLQPVVELDTHAARAYAWSFKTTPDASLWWMQQWTDAYGLRPALPYLDPSLPAYISRLANLSHDRGEFRELALTSLPRDLAYNRKIGQSVPLRSWFKGPLRQFLAGRITDRAVLEGFLKPTEVDRILAEHLSGERDHKWLLWKMLSLITWKENFERYLQK